MTPHARVTLFAAAARSLGLWGWSALAAVALAGIALLAQVSTLTIAVFSSSASVATTSSPDAARIESFRASFEDHLAQINGRSMFFIPPAPPPPAPVAENKEPGEPPAPSKYGGPAVIAMINGAVWFDNGTRLRADEAASAGLRVITVNSPWGARIEWSGGEWDVPLFDRTTDRFLETPPPDPAPEAPTDD